MKQASSFWMVVCFASISWADPNWTQFRGSDRSGVAQGQTPPTELNLKKTLKWKVAVPNGSSSPIIYGDRIFLTAFEQNKLYTLCYSTQGKPLWKVAAPTKGIEPFHRTEGSPAASTPATDGKNLIVYFGSCGLLCYDLDGKQKWHYEMPVAETDNSFGTGTSPILEDGVVYLVRDLSKNSLMLAIDAEKGSLLWKKPREGYPTAYCTPIIWNNNGTKQLIVPGNARLRAYDPKTGDEIWGTENLPSVACTTPVVGDGQLFFAGWAPGQDDMQMPLFEELIKDVDEDKDGALSAKESQKTFLKDFFENNDTNKDGKITREEWTATITFMKRGQNLAFAIKPGGKGDITHSHVSWKKSKGLPYVPSPLYYQGHLFLIKDGGLATCYNAKTGKEVYTQERIGASGMYYASPVAANGHIYVVSVEGTVSVLKFGGEEPEVVSQVKLGEANRASPAIANHVLYVRTSEHLYAFGP